MLELPLPLASLNGDSSVHGVRFAAGVAECLWEDSDGTPYRLQVRTDTLYSEADAEHSSVHLEIEELATALPVDVASGRYQAPLDFGGQMRLVREGRHLALGRRQQEWPFLLRIRGYRLLLACPVRTLEDITLRPGMD